MKTNLFKLAAFIVFTTLFINSCGIYKRSDIKDNPVNVDERVKRNIQEGRGFKFGKGATRGGDFDFASSNPLWRGAVDILDFVPLAIPDKVTAFIKLSIIFCVSSFPASADCFFCCISFP